MFTPVEKAIDAYFDQEIVDFQSTVRVIDFFGDTKPKGTPDFSKPIDEESLVRFVRSEKGALKREFLIRTRVSIDTFIDFRFGSPLEYYAEDKSPEDITEQLLFDKASADVKPTIRLYLDGRKNPIEVMTEFGFVGMVDPSTVALFVGDILACVEAHSKNPSLLARSAAEDSVGYVLARAFSYFSSGDKVHSLKADLFYEYRVNILETEDARKKLQNSLQDQFNTIVHQSDGSIVKEAQQMIAERMKRLYPSGFLPQNESEANVIDRPRTAFPLKEFAIFAGAVAIGIAVANKARSKKFEIPNS